MPNSVAAEWPNHALQRTAPCVTAPASAAAFPPAMQVPRHAPPSLSLGSLGSYTTIPMKPIYLLCFAVLALLSGCSKPDSADYFPLTRTMRYEYSVEFSGPFGGTQKGRRVEQVTGTETIDGKDYFRVNLVFENMPWAQDRVEFRRTTPEGIYQRPSKNGTEALTVPFPFKVGSTWSYSYGANYKCDITGSALEDFVSVSKTYKDCVKLYYKTPYEEGFGYLARGIGPVGGSLTLELPNQAPLKIKEVLTDFHK